MPLVYLKPKSLEQTFNVHSSLAKSTTRNFNNISNEVTFAKPSSINYTRLQSRGQVPFRAKCLYNLREQK